VPADTVTGALQLAEALLLSERKSSPHRISFSKKVVRLLFNTLVQLATELTLCAAEFTSGTSEPLTFFLDTFFLPTLVSARRVC
jgi:hypothetical protein